MTKNIAVKIQQRSTNEQQFSKSNDGIILGICSLAKTAALASNS